MPGAVKSHRRNLSRFRSRPVSSGALGCSWGCRVRPGPPSPVLSPPSCLRGAECPAELGIVLCPQPPRCGDKAGTMQRGHGCHSCPLLK